MWVPSNPRGSYIGMSLQSPHTVHHFCRGYSYKDLLLLHEYAPCSISLAIHLCTYTCRTNHQGCSHMWLRSHTRCERKDPDLDSFVLSRRIFHPRCIPIGTHISRSDNLHVDRSQHSCPLDIYLRYILDLCIHTTPLHWHLCTFRCVDRGSGDMGQVLHSPSL